MSSKYPTGDMITVSDRFRLFKKQIKELENEVVKLKVERDEHLLEIEYLKKDNDKILGEARDFIGQNVRLKRKLMGMK